MSKDYIVDLLNDLDEDLILEAAKCRTIQKSHYKKWMFPTAIAASFCIAVSAFFYAGGFELFAQSSENDLAMEDSNLSFSLQENIEEKQDTTEQYVQEVPSVIVKLDSWSSDGFTGTVTGLVDTDALPLGSRVTVKTDSNTDMMLSEYSEGSVIEKSQINANISEAITVRVMFHPWNGDDFAEFQYDTEQIYYIYAEQVILVEDTAVERRKEQ